jgi:histidyl-tRNA synthetase
MINNDIKIDALQRGTRILYGDPVALKRATINAWSKWMSQAGGFQEVELPSIEAASIYTDKAGAEIVERQMYTFQDKKGREVCLRPEGTATCQLIAQQYRFDKDVKIFYATRCWRYERPQEGRYREFTQFGVEILNPTKDHTDWLIDLSKTLLSISLLVVGRELILNEGCKRGLAYYTDGCGWEIEAPILGAQKQVLGGGAYAEGIGFAIGVDRVLLALSKLYPGREKELIAHLEYGVPRI